MPRPRGFDEREVLDHAMAAFWASGYDATTLDDLEAATGLGRGSLYAAFGDKRALFLKAVERYFEAALEREALHLDPSRGKTAIGEFFRAVLARALADPAHRGCMLTNCAVELAARDAEVALRVGRHFDRLERAFLRVIVAAQAGGEIDPSRDAHRLARSLVASLQGLQVLARVRPDPAWLEDVAGAVEDGL